LIKPYIPNRVLSNPILEISSGSLLFNDIETGTSKLIICPKIKPVARVLV